MVKPDGQIFRKISKEQELEEEKAFEDWISEDYDPRDVLRHHYLRAESHGAGKWLDKKLHRGRLKRLQFTKTKQVDYKGRLLVQIVDSEYPQTCTYLSEHRLNIVLARYNSYRYDSFEPDADGIATVSFVDQKDVYFKGSFEEILRWWSKKRNEWEGVTEQAHRSHVTHFLQHCNHHRARQCACYADLLTRRQKLFTFVPRWYLFIELEFKKRKCRNKKRCTCPIEDRLYDEGGETE